jgi:hypothetical protein
MTGSQKIYAAVWPRWPALHSEHFGAVTFKWAKQLSDRNDRTGDEITLDEVERITI